MNTYWDLFEKSGAIEQYLKYKSQLEAVEGRNDDDGYANGYANGYTSGYTNGFARESKKNSGGCN